MSDEQKPKILDQTLSDVLQNNNQAQGMVMKAMQITPQQFQDMLKQTGNNQLMNMKISDLFKNGVFQQAQAMNQGQVINGQVQQVSPEQFQQIMGTIQNGQMTQAIPLQQIPIQQLHIQQIPLQQVPVQQVPVQQIPQATEGQVFQQAPEFSQVNTKNPSFFQRLKNLFK